MESDQDKQPIGLTKDTGWQIGARRTFPLGLEAAWRLIISPAGLQTWLGAPRGTFHEQGGRYDLPDGTTGEMRVYKPNSHVRLTWHPPDWPRPSTIQVRVISSGEKTVISFHQEHMPGPEAREARRSFFKTALDQLGDIIKAGSVR
jgi:uncharacterized protein YndB with AHSA1/START domain